MVGPSSTGRKSHPPKKISYVTQVLVSQDLDIEDLELEATDEDGFGHP